MSSPIVHLHKALSTESLNFRHETSQHRLTLQHIFNSCVLDKHQRVHAGELIRHFRFVAEQNVELLSVQFDFNFLLNELGGSDQQVTFDQLFNAVEKLYSQLVDESSVSTPTSKSISSMSLNASLSSLKRRRNKENIDLHTSDDASSSPFDSRKKSNDHEKCKIERNELLEINRRQTECLRMLEDEYKKLEDDHQHLQTQYEEVQKKNLTLEDDLNRSSRYINENVDLHVFKNKLEISYRDLKEENQSYEREKFELQEQLIDMETQLQMIRNERDYYMNRLIDVEDELKNESDSRQQFEEHFNLMQNQLKENDQSINALRSALDELNLSHEDAKRKNENLEKTVEELRQQLRNAKTESIEARLSLSNLCDEESFLCDELEEPVDVSRRATISNGQSLFAEINTMSNISNECVSQCLDSSNMETSDDIEVQILLSKTDSFNSIHLKDVFHELHVNGMNINEHLMILLNKISGEQDREYIVTATNLVDKHLLAIKNLIKKVIDNKDVFEGRFRKLQTLLIASREKQRRFESDLNEFSNSIQSNLTSANIVFILKDYHNVIEELKHREKISDEKINRLEEQLLQLKDDRSIESVNTKANLTEKQEQVGDTALLSLKKIRSRNNLSNLTAGICPFHSIRELLRDDYELFNSTSSLLPCRCFNRSRSSPSITQTQSSIEHIRRLSSPCPSMPSATTVRTTDSGLNTSTSRSPTPDLHEDIPSMVFEFDSIFNQILTTETNGSKQNNKKSFRSVDRSVSTKSTQSTRIKRILKKLQWSAIITSCSIVLFIWSVIVRYYFLTSPNDDDCNRLSFAWWPFVYCSTNGITL
ncbi:unnamed protein product [Rotaria magnacalcarata]|uniref:EB1 C-terminal domain-containing protein n=3 Tax=Rotaria magnacalcarata TaxID=392030 RepID=A0A816Q132_9BILA|nr:unnamed protein product [Rotaria magnacalcarata]CAF4148383.1 unnamed protein product [Rotaria magnacalcarata]